MSSKNNDLTKDTDSINSETSRLGKENLLKEVNRKTRDNHSSNPNYYTRLKNIEKLETSSLEELHSFIDKMGLSSDKDTFNFSNSNHNKWKFSLISLASVVDFMMETNLKKRLYYDDVLEIFCVDLQRKTSLGYYITMNLQFLRNGNINFIVSDSEDENTSLIRGTITKYKNYKNTYRFLSVINMLYYV